VERSLGKGLSNRGLSLPTFQELNYKRKDNLMEGRKRVPEERKKGIK